MSAGTSPPTALLGIATATPAHPVQQDDLLPWLAALLAGRVDRARLRAILRASRVRTRYTVLQEHAPEFPGVPFGAKEPGTDARLASFGLHGPALAVRAGARAIGRAALARSAPVRARHVVVVTSTGRIDARFAAEIRGGLGLDDATCEGIEDQGCEGFYHGLARARQRVANSGGATLLLCVETPSLHFRPDPSLANLSALALFGDGCGALVLAPPAPEDRVRLGATLTEMDAPDSPHASWSFGGDGLQFAPPCGDARTPFLRLPDRLARLLGGARPHHWCLHPSDPVTLRRTEQALGLTRSETRGAWDALRSHGSTISAGSVHVLAGVFPRLLPGETAVLASVRPGRSTHAVALRGR